MARCTALVNPWMPPAVGRHAWRGMAALALCQGLAAQAAPTVLAPQFGLEAATGSGAQAAFYRVDNDWRGSTVLWNEATRSYGSGVEIGSYGWGTGLWGRADWSTVADAAAGHPRAGAPALQQGWSGAVSSINFGNSRYNECHAGTWGAAALLPFFGSAAPVGNCGDAEAGDPLQQNWIAQFSGFIRITTAGEYNFSVLYDDGFFFRLIGEGGSGLGIEQDFLNPRDREGYADNLLLSPGLYGFELGSWNRLGAGVVDLRWRTPGDTGEWTLVPTDHLALVTVTDGTVPEPGVPALLAAAGLAGWGLRRQRRSRPQPA